MVGPFVLGGRFSPLRQSEVLFVEVMTHLISHRGGFAGGVVEHPRPDPYAEGVPGSRSGGDPRAGFRTSILDIWVSCDS